MSVLTYPVSGTDIVHVGRWAITWLDELVDADASLVDTDLKENTGNSLYYTLG